MQSFLKGFSWVSLVLIFGLLQLWFVLSWDYVRSDYSIESGKVFADGILIFFATALISSITIDYHFSKPNIQHRLNRMSRHAVVLLFTFVPMMLIAASVGVYSASFNVSLESIEIDRANLYQYTITFAAILHALISKTLMFKVEK